MTALATDPLAALRAATHALHTRLDRQLPVARDGAGVADYVAHLRASAAWLDILAPWLGRLGHALPASRARACIALDLAACGAPEPVIAPASGAIRLRSACDGSDAFCWGVAYVAEGAALGGQVLRRRLVPPLSPAQTLYLAGEGEATGARWRHVMACLREQLADSRRVQSACLGAVAAFEEFGLLALPAMRADELAG